MSGVCLCAALPLPSHVVKRDGRVVSFDAGKIASALARAGGASGEFGADEALRLSTQGVVPRILALGALTPHIEQIQDAVESTLVYVEASVSEYLQRRDGRVNASTNQGYSLGGLILNVSGKVIANYWLDHVHPPEAGRAHREADLHIHDLDMLSGYCGRWSLRTLLHEGLNGVPGKLEAGPPKHLSSAVGQIVDFLGTLQNEWAGAKASVPSIPAWRPSPTSPSTGCVRRICAARCR